MTIRRVGTRRRDFLTVWSRHSSGATQFSAVAGTHGPRFKIRNIFQQFNDDNEKWNSRRARLKRTLLQCGQRRVVFL